MISMLGRLMSGAPDRELPDQRPCWSLDAIELELKKHQMSTCGC
jgi:hypothetical protein